MRPSPRAGDRGTKLGSYELGRRLILGRRGHLTPEGPGCSSDLSSSPSKEPAAAPLVVAISPSSFAGVSPRTSAEISSTLVPEGVPISAPL